MIRADAETVLHSDSGTQPMSEHQTANNGNSKCMPSAQADDLKQKTVHDKEKSAQIPKKDEVTRHLVLEERHSLSLAETKKRRASVYSDEHLFIPKQLARSELQFRTRNFCNTTSKKRDCHLRMLKYPLDSKRVRYVAEKMKKVQSVSEQPESEKPQDTPSVMEEINTVHIKQEEFFNDSNSPDLPLSMPDLDTETEVVKNQLPDNEDCITLLDLVKKEVEDEDSSEGMNRELLQSQRQSVIMSNFTKGQHYPYLRWHNPEEEIKMEVMDECQGQSTLENPTTTEGNDNHNEVAGQQEFIQELSSPQISDKTEEAQIYLQEPVLEEQPVELDLHNPQVSDGIQHDMQIKQNVQIVQDLELPRMPQDLQMEHILPEPEVIDFSQNGLSQSTSTQYVAELPTSSMNTSSGQSTLRQHLLHHIVRPTSFNQDVCQSTSFNNNAIERINQNIRTPHYVETPAIPIHPSPLQWNSHNFAHKPQLAQQHQELQRQQELQRYQHPPNLQQHEIMYKQQQNDLQLQELRLLHQRLQCREHNELVEIGLSLTRVYEERLSYELKHKEEKRLYQLKMEQSKKVEEKLNADKEQLQRQMRAELRILEQRIADQQRQQILENAHKNLRTLQHQQQHLQQHGVFHQPSTYMYASNFQESINYQQYQQVGLPVESHVPDPTTEFQSRLWVPPPPYCPTSSKSLEETPKEPPKKTRQRRKNTEKRATVAPYTAPIVQSLPPNNPVQGDTAQHSAASVSEYRNENITTVMENYVSNYLNKNMHS
ncbi:uncharacterized protein Dana_GF23608 [Drosophila ananassae]|uniref:Uncharacterized protein n=1 Tax=Drosophila ananassae TaxID=7217 RepID=B3M8S2_DROAN|nr:uncharacterized protein Dana_GF23608 [Drosophila ananassae]